MGLALATAFCFSGVSCSLISETGPLKDSITGGSDGYQLIEVRSRADLPSQNRVYKAAKVPPSIKGQGYSDRIRARDSLTFVITDLAEQSPFFSKGSSFLFGPLETPEDGRVNIPYVGEIQIIDQTLSEASATVEERTKLVSNTAQVSVTRKDRFPRTANVVGEVRKPGPIPLEQSGLTSLDLLAAAGGPEKADYLFNYNLRRGGVDYLFDYEGFRKNPFVIEEGDLLTVTTDVSNRFHVMGAINRPVTVEFPVPNPTLADAIGAATGLDEKRSDPSGVFVFRKGEPDLVFTFDMKNPAVLPLMQRFPMRGEDIVYITEAPLTRWNRMITQILPITVSQAAGTAVRYVN
jgi:polysaccharide export outer membrane protein